MTGEKGPTSFDVQVRRWTVRGMVQGVGFRMFVVRVATRLELRGTVRNIPDGSVEVLAAGQLPELDLLEQQLGKGPPASRVDGVERIEDGTPVESLPDNFTVTR